MTAKDLAEKNRAYLRSDAYRMICGRVIANTATLEDLRTFISTELQESMDCTEPMAPDNGRTIDNWHASACVLRAWVVLTGQQFSEALKHK